MIKMASVGRPLLIAARGAAGTAAAPVARIAMNASTRGVSTTVQGSLAGMKLTKSGLLVPRGISAAVESRSLSLLTGDDNSPPHVEKVEKVADPAARARVDAIPSAAESKAVKRFYKTVGIEAVNAELEQVPEEQATGWRVLIDGRPMRTVGAKPLVAPTKPLALAVAAEWAAQTKFIMNSSTPIYNLLSAAHDQFPVEDERLRERIHDYLETDTVCFRVDDSEGDPRDALCLRRQNKYYNPLIEWFEERFGGPLDICIGIGVPSHPQDVLDRVLEPVATADIYMKSALSALLDTCKSTVIAYALLYRHISINQAFDAARVEEEHQIEDNGFVFDGHDTSRAHYWTKLSAVSTFMWHLPASQPAPLPKKFDSPFAQQQKRAAAQED